MNRLYELGYVAYRTLAALLFCLMLIQSVMDWQFEGRILSLLLRFGATLFWSNALWVSPEFLSGRWEKTYARRIWWRKPSLLWVPMLLLAILGGSAGFFLLLVFTVLFLNYNWAPASFAVASAGTALLMVPQVVAHIRLYFHMRDGKWAGSYNLHGK